ncbi:MAG: polymer-forming cytoskeletal protein [Gemmatimonadetes bacterium]|jgi:cytoskeletal protein CcmA (bactofilin family)|nr:polymer-forming cytoskeletal protein [Gemmatimonadota bacterium]MBT4612906.1 polymer-forming cytoskeletal protein [Gemmatimonadota bacterium]MBT5055040.1 polymer-forming cytoskeletal protein [Gemmatimonadota bacterium]MBT5143331.1 polymer-forming cytoskeletal protein [Gemmatimonadota bacterium]MBT5586735.1 polymer-forming cytoskeletal protein [Gemmatimonadota bacterium]
MNREETTRSESATVIGQGSSMVGTLEVGNTVHVEGSFRGTLRTPERLEVGEEGLVEAEQLEVGEAIVRGRVSGHLQASREIHFTSTAAFRGSVKTPKLVIEEGARLDVTDAPADPPAEEESGSAA